MKYKLGVVCVCEWATSNKGRSEGRNVPSNSGYLIIHVDLWDDVSPSRTTYSRHTAILHFVPIHSEQTSNTSTIDGTAHGGDRVEIEPVNITYTRLCRLCVRERARA